jgi:hypothetical protein
MMRDTLDLPEFSPEFVECGGFFGQRTLSPVDLASAKRLTSGP